MTLSSPLSLSGPPFPHLPSTDHTPYPYPRLLVDQDTGVRGGDPEDMGDRRTAEQEGRGGDSPPGCGARGCPGRGRNADGLSHQPCQSSWESALFLDTESEETQEAPRAGEVAQQDKQGKWQPLAPGRTPCQVQPCPHWDCASASPGREGRFVLRKHQPEGTVVLTSALGKSPCDGGLGLCCQGAPARGVRV